LLRGFNPRFSNTVDDITNSVVLPTFARALNKLVLKELCLANDEKTVANTVFLAVVGSGCTNPGGCSSTTAGASSSSHNSHSGVYGSGTSGGNSDGHNSGSGSKFKGKGKGKGKGKRG
jgi:hypothetical protein